MSSGSQKETPGAVRPALWSAAILILILVAAPRVFASTDAKVRGAEIFANVGCVHCHGVGGITGGRGPSLLDVRKRRKPAEIYSQIHDGGKSMPEFGDQLTSDQINDVVKYLRSKRKVPPRAP